MPKINVPGYTLDTDRVTNVIANEGDADTVTLVFDGAHDDTDNNGRPLKGGATGDYGKDMPKGVNNAHVGNRMTFPRGVLETAGFFEVYTGPGSEPKTAPAKPAA
jgi:hypothetical protein